GADGVPARGANEGGEPDATTPFAVAPRAPRRVRCRPLPLGVGGVGGPAATEFGRHLVRLVATSIVTIGATAIQDRHPWRKLVNLRALANARVESHETQARYQLLIDTAGSAIIALSPEYRILEFNREAEAIYGWRGADVLWKDYLELFQPVERRADVAAMIQRILAGATVQGFEAC